MMPRAPLGQGPIGTLFATLAVFVWGCAADTKSDETGSSCSKDSECPASQECLLAGASSLRQPIVFNPCALVIPCTTSSTCASGQVCAPYVPLAPGPNCPAMTCAPACTATSCPTDQVCGTDGLCQFESCAEDGAPACSAQYRCDPAAAAAGVQPLAGSSVVDSASADRESKRGCVRRQCDEEGGFSCRPYWTCDPERAMNEASGCVPDSCQDTGHCQGDNYICEPENDGPRPSGTDPHGCVQRNCGEGFTCSRLQESINYSYCDLESDEADIYGCLLRKCDEDPRACLAGYTCDLAATSKNALGCRPLDCNEAGGRECGNGTTCLPLPNSNGSHGCRTATAGTGGSGGSSSDTGGVAGQSSGGTGGIVSAPNGGRTDSAGALNATGGKAGRSNATAGSNDSSDPGSVGTCVDRE